MEYSVDRYYWWLWKKALIALWGKKTQHTTLTTKKQTMSYSFYQSDKKFEDKYWQHGKWKLWFCFYYFSLIVCWRVARETGTHIHIYIVTMVFVCLLVFFSFFFFFSPIENLWNVEILIFQMRRYLAEIGNKSLVYSAIYKSSLRI